ncbi:MAG TPA: COX15/CtaA family protein [Candidatus Acidoferrales bacterium]|nr:COX15/CtaA family protein [Candidatus Acidoferrales bacterium]
MADRVSFGRAWGHRLALLAAGLTLPLLFMGGLVTTKGVGLIVPDWPTTFGENMFLFPWSKMVGGVFYEHSHRLLGAAVGLVTLVLAVWLWLRETRRWVRFLGIAAFLLVVIQGVLGGLRVVLADPTLALVHACLAQAFFALASALATVTSRGWQESHARECSDEAEKIRRLGILTTALIYAQIVLGALLRHTGSYLEAHLIVAALVVAHVVWLIRRILRSGADRKLARAAGALGVALAVQLGLGLGAYLKFFPGTIPYAALEWLITSHVLGGAMLLVSALSVTLWSYRVLAPAEKIAPALAVEQVGG